MSRVRENRTHGSTGGGWKRNAPASPRQPPTQPTSCDWEVGTTRAAYTGVVAEALMIKAAVNAGSDARSRLCTRLSRCRQGVTEVLQRRLDRPALHRPTPHITDGTSRTTSASSGKGIIHSRSSGPQGMPRGVGSSAILYVSRLWVACTCSRSGVGQRARTNRTACPGPSCAASARPGLRTTASTG